MVLDKYEVPWRPVYEAYAGTAWTVSAAACGLVSITTQMPSAPFILAFTASSSMALVRWNKAWKLWSLKMSLAGKSVFTMHPDELVKKVKSNPDCMWLGLGFDWKPIHTQRVYDLKRLDVSELYPPDWFLKLRGVSEPAQDKNAIGSPWIHGVETAETDLLVPLNNLEGHTVIFGTTGCGKTRMFEVLITQAIHRGDCVWIIDPKGDKDLRERARIECIRAGRADKFVFFHPAFPEQSIRIDPLKNWNRPTEIASRIAALVPSETGADAFTAFAWRSINLIAQGLILVDQRPNLMRLRKYVEGGPDGLLEQTLEAHFKRIMPGRWEDLVKSAIELGRKEGVKHPTASAKLIGYVAFYEKELGQNPAHSDEVIDGLINMFRHNREHASKMLAALVPILNMLTASELGKLLSPDTEDLNDSRPIMDTEKLINGKYVVYMGLDSMSDATVSSAIGSITLADLTSVAGARYNFGIPDNTKISLFVDEAAEVTNVPFIQILNKGRGAGFVAYVATQVFPDFVAKLGSEDKARQMLGNFNNLIAMRTKDRTTQDFIVETIGQAYVEAVQASSSTNATTEDNIAHFSGGIGVRQSSTLEDAFPADLLGQLPNFQYISVVSGGRLGKGRVPILAKG
ncbi:conjugative transfer system coupling protein TraD [Duganella vulcania]|uniref:Conjugative transfer system coupling protein TraD n=1 Tax=Duganella vulcania TaxID=2692166 RepID=A0A845GEJ6_9BURK|nr:conjugative transfer system coupling protein TraD [Duganella vulcania]MYM92724.1 conjugative transfer system coupling protein TraD [Duganella vulcania]